MLEDSGLASLLVDWQSVVARADPAGPLFPPVAVLRDTLGRALRALDDGSWETRGLRFVWHSLRHGGASRAFLPGGAVVLPDLLVRGPWAVEASGRHYIQSGCQLLLSLTLPAEMSTLVRGYRALGIASLALPDFAAWLATHM